MVQSRWFAAFCTLNLILILAGALWFRSTSLAMRAPNGDETFYGVQAAKLLQGENTASQTSSGNLLNLMVLLPEVPLYAILGPTDLTLMLPAALAGILAVIAAYFLIGNALDRTTGLIAGTLLAVLPIGIIVGRIAAEGAWVPLVGLVALALALRGHRLGTALGVLWCYYAHPTHLFLLPVFLLVLTQKIWERTAGDWTRRRWELASVVVGTILIVLPLTLITSNRSAIQWTYEHYNFGPSNWSLYFLYYERMLMGFCDWGPPETSRQFDLLFWTVVLSVLAVGLVRLSYQRRWDCLAFLLGLSVTITGMHLVTGPDILRPYLVRYGHYLIAPSVIAFAMLLRSLFPEPGTRWRSALRFGQASAFFGLAWTLLVVTKLNFFGWFLPQLMGQENFWTLPTEAVDPKQWVASIIEEDLGTDPVPRVVLAEDWWTYRPVQYYLSEEDRIVPGSLEHFDETTKAKLIQRHLQQGGYIVGTVGQPVITTVEGLVPPEQLQGWRVACPPYAALAVYRLKREDELLEVTPIALQQPLGIVDSSIRR